VDYANNKTVTMNASCIGSLTLPLSLHSLTPLSLRTYTCFSYVVVTLVSFERNQVVGYVKYALSAVETEPVELHVRLLSNPVDNELVSFPSAHLTCYSNLASKAHFHCRKVAQGWIHTLLACYFSFMR
jgi:hypothetical protein